MFPSLSQWDGRRDKSRRGTHECVRHVHWRKMVGEPIRGLSCLAVLSLGIRPSRSNSGNGGRSARQGARVKNGGGPSLIGRRISSLGIHSTGIMWMTPRRMLWRDAIRLVRLARSGFITRMSVGDGVSKAERGATSTAGMQEGGR
jgi:hypothetical protein